MNCNGWLGWILKRRFTRTGIFLEYRICDMLGHRWLNGDRVSWEICRTNLYEYWLEGWTEEEIKAKVSIPSVVLHSWFIIWESYYKAWRFVNEIKTDVNGRGDQGDF